MGRILIVDDSDGSRALLAAIVKAAGHQVVASCRNGREGIAAVEAFAPEVLMLDMLMPLMDGIEVLQQLRGMARKPKVIMLSSVSAKDKIRAAWEAGAHQYLLKPYEFEKVKATLARVLEGNPVAVLPGALPIR